MTAQILTTSEVKALWDTTCLTLKSKLSEAVFNTWIVNNPLIKIEIGEEEAKATIACPTPFHANNIRKNLSGEIKVVLDGLLEKDTQIEFEIGVVGKIDSRASVEQANAAGSTAMPGPTPTIAPAQPRIKPQSPRVEDLFSDSTIRSLSIDRALLAAKQAGLKSDYIFETFAVSTTNEMAHAAATAVSNQPGRAYNPLFLYGGVGVGKTHIMHAIGNNILKNNPDSRILYCTGEEFTNEIVSAIQNKKAGRFKDKYRNADVLLIDDVQFIAGKNAVQEEFFHTFNALTKQSSQIVITSDRPPQEINLLEDRLRSRFEAGLIIDIQQPSFELRTAILLIKAQAAGLNIPMNLAQDMAAKLDSARKIEGIIKSIRSEVELKRREIGPELINELLSFENADQLKTIRVAPTDVIRLVANHYHLKQSEVKGLSRNQEIVKARHVAMFLMNRDLKISLIETARWFSGRDHTSALHAVRKIAREAQLNDLLRRDVSALRMSLSAISN